MPEPTSTTAGIVTLATMATMAAAPPVLTILGVSLGLRADVLLPGFHVNALGDVPESWRDYIVTPRQPLAVFGDGNA